MTPEENERIVGLSRSQAFDALISAAAGAVLAIVARGAKHPDLRTMMEVAGGGISVIAVFLAFAQWFSARFLLPPQELTQARFVWRLPPTAWASFRLLQEDFARKRLRYGIVFIALCGGVTLIPLGINELWNGHFAYTPGFLIPAVFFFAFVARIQAQNSALRRSMPLEVAFFPTKISLHGSIQYLEGIIQLTGVELVPGDPPIMRFFVIDGTSDCGTPCVGIEVPVYPDFGPEAEEILAFYRSRTRPVPTV